MSDTPDFVSKLLGSVNANDSLLCVGLDPQPAQMPARYHSSNGNSLQSLIAWNIDIIEATAPYAAVYKPNIAFYEALGHSGNDLLRATLDAIPGNIPVLLDAKRGDMGNTAMAYAQAVFDYWQVDAVTLNPYLGRDSVEPFLKYPGKGLFIVCHTSNPGATDFQEFEVSDWRSLDREANQPLYIHVARTVCPWSNRIGLVVGATFPEAIAATRAAAPDCWFLIPGIGAQGGDLEASVKAGLRADSQGIIVNASRSLAQADNPGAAAKELRDAINRSRTAKSYPVPDFTSTPPTSLQPNEQKLIDGLVDLGAVKFGDFTLASGQHSPIYIDLRLLVSEPALLTLAAEAYSKLVSDLEVARIAGVPYAALPIATAVSLQLGLPMIYTRKEVKAHGLGKDVEGLWQPGEKVVMIEDLITSGGSIIKSAERLRELGMIIDDVVVLIDRGQGGVENLEGSGITAHAVFTLPQLLDYLVMRERLSHELASTVRTFLNGN